MTHEQAVWLVAGVFIGRTAPDPEMSKEFIKEVMLRYNVSYLEQVATDVETNPIMEDCQNFVRARRI